MKWSSINKANKLHKFENQKEFYHLILTPKKKSLLLDYNLVQKMKLTDVILKLSKEGDSIYMYGR